MSWIGFKDKVPLSFKDYFEGKDGVNICVDKHAKDIYKLLCMIKKDVLLKYPSTYAEIDHIMLLACFIEEGTIYYSPETLRNIELNTIPLQEREERLGKLSEALKDKVKVSGTVYQQLKNILSTAADKAKTPEQAMQLISIIRSYRVLVTKLDVGTDVGNEKNVSREMVGY